MRALRSAAALMRGAAGLALVSQRAAPASAGALAAAELARRLDHGWAARHAATAAGHDSERGTPTSEAPDKDKRAEKTADGEPKPDERTVADLVSQLDHNALLRRLELLQSLGYTNALAMVLAEPAVKEATLLDGLTTQELQAKLDILLRLLTKF